MASGGRRPNCRRERAGAAGAGGRGREAAAASQGERRRRRGRAGPGTADGRVGEGAAVATPAAASAVWAGREARFQPRVPSDPGSTCRAGPLGEEREKKKEDRLFFRSQDCASARAALEKSSPVARREARKRTARAHLGTRQGLRGSTCFMNSGGTGRGLRNLLFCDGDGRRSPARPADEFERGAIQASAEATAGGSRGRRGFKTVRQTQRDYGEWNPYPSDFLTDPHSMFGGATHEATEIMEKWNGESPISHP
ncbi:uncharacterized protein LOC103159269 [Cricetulus griseus]|uniref:Uncharacterized protein LOC103159269 n=1 Tax=Cricetulus griseus TaxID=10029 RepID=A0A9J7H7Z8_CRIGR|nr:uncharacterized protein LOC103159269 [Cricetulus griseus]